MSPKGKELYEFGPYRLDPHKRVLMRNRELVPLQRKAFETLLELVRHSDQVVLKDDLMKAVWPDTFVEESNLTQNIFVLRKTLGGTGECRYIATVPGRGYRFVQKVRPVPEEEIVFVESSRSRIVIEEDVVEEGGGRNTEVSTLYGNSLSALPGGVSNARWPWQWIIPPAIIGTALGVSVLWALFSQPPTPRVLRSVRLTHSGRVSPSSRILSDGFRLYFTETVGAKWGLAQVPVAGGEPTPIAASLPSVALEDIDSTRSRILIAPQGPDPIPPLWVIPTAGGSAQRFGDIAAADSAWSPDGQRIVYCREGSIYAAEADGSQSRKLLSVHGFIEFLRWSPDGRRLRFTVRDPADGGRSIWEASAAGADPHPLALGWKSYAHGWGEGEYSGDWTHDGRYFVFRSERSGVQSFWAIREETRWPHRAHSAPIQIYTSPDRMGEPRFSADGRKIFFVSDQEQRELVRYDSARKLFVPYLGGIPARLLSFSPDGQWVAYKNDIDGSLWRSRVDGAERMQLTFPPLFAMHSSWAPDGKTIVFQGYLPGEPAKLFTVPAAGGKPEVVLRDPEASLAGPSWCGDGKSILFMRWNSNTQGEVSSGITVLDLKSRETHLLPGTAGFDGVHCSPDGKYAAASDQVNRKLMLFDFGSHHWSALSDGTPYGWGIRWSTDSRYVYYQHADEEEEQPIFRVRISDRKVEQITSYRQIQRADVRSYTMTGLTPDNSPVASLVRRNSDVYALELDLP